MCVVMVTKTHWDPKAINLHPFLDIKYNFEIIKGVEGITLNRMILDKIFHCVYG